MFVLNVQPKEIILNHMLPLLSRRVLCATALGHTVAEAQQRAYALMADIRWNGSFSRNDIGYRAIARERGE